MISSTVVIGASGQRLVTRVEASPSPFRGTSPRHPTRGATRPARHRHRLHPSEGYAGTPKGGNRVRAAQNAHAEIVVSIAGPAFVVPRVEWTLPAQQAHWGRSVHQVPE